MEDLPDPDSEADSGAQGEEQADGNVPVLNLDAPESRRLTLKVTEEVSGQILSALKKGSKIVLTDINVYEDYETNRIYTGWSLEPDPDDPCSLFINYNEADELFGHEKLLVYNLTHKALSRPYNYVLMDEISWEDPETILSSGDSQVRQDEITEPFCFFQLDPGDRNTADLRAEAASVLTRKLDVLGDPYAIGYTDKGSICVRMKTGHLCRTVLNLLEINIGGSSLFLYAPRARRSIIPDYSRFRFDPDTGAIEMTLSEETVRSLQDMLPELSGQNPAALYLETEAGPFARCVLSAMPENNSISFTELFSDTDEQNNADYKWLADLLQTVIDTGSAFQDSYNVESYYVQDSGRIRINDPGPFPFRERNYVPLQEIEKKVRAVVPAASVGLSADERNLMIRFHLDVDTSFPERFFRLTPVVLDAVFEEEEYFNTITIYPCDPVGDERAWLMFTKSANVPGEYDAEPDSPQQIRTSFNGYLFNGRLDAGADKILELMEKDTWFSSMILNPEYHGWMLRDF